MTTGLITLAVGASLLMLAFVLGVINMVYMTKQGGIGSSGFALHITFACFNGLGAITLVVGGILVLAGR